MGVDLNPILVNESKVLLNEIKLIPKFPNLKSFTDFKLNFIRKVPELKNVDFTKYSKFSKDTDNATDLANNISTIKPVWIASIMDVSKVSKNTAEAALNSTLSLLKIIDSNKVKNLDLFTDINGKPLYKTIPKGLQDKVLYLYEKANPKGYQEFELKLKTKGTLDKLISDKAKTITNKETGKPYTQAQLKKAWKLVSDEGDLALKNALDKGWKPGLDPKKFVSSGTVEKQMSPSGKFQSGTVGAKVEELGYDLKTVQDEFGVTPFSKRNEKLNADDNLKLKEALDSGWKPGEPVPEEFQTNFYKLRESSENVIEITDDAGKKTTIPDDIFKSSKWEEIDAVKLTDEEIKTLLNRPWWDRVVTNFKAFWGFTDEKMIQLKKIASALNQVEKGSPEFVKLNTLLEKELKKLFKLSFNSFITMRNFLDKIKDTEFQKIWKKIKEDSNDNWLNEFGTISKHVPPMEKFFAGIKNNFVLVEDYEKSFAIGVLNRIKKVGKLFGKKVVSDTEVNKVSDGIFNNFVRTWATGSKSGFPYMGNPRYKELITTKGLGAARISYIKDLAWNKLKYAVLFSFLSWFKDFMADQIISDEREECFIANKKFDEDSKNLKNRLDSGDINQETFKKELEILQNNSYEVCKELEGSFNELLVKWSKNLRPDLETDRKKHTEVFLSKLYDRLYPKILSKEDFKWYKADPGLAGETLSTSWNILEVILNSDDKPGAIIERQNKIKEKLDEIEEKGKEALKNTKEKVSDDLDKREEPQSTVMLTNSLEDVVDYVSKNYPGDSDLSAGLADTSKYAKQNVFTFNDVYCAYNFDNKVYTCFFYNTGDKKVYTTKVIPSNGSYDVTQQNKFPSSEWKELPPKQVNENIEKIIKNILKSNMKIGNKKRIFEDEEKFGENKFDHWYDTFKFEKYDENSGEFKEIDVDSLKHRLIKDKYNDFIKTYDSDDAFVRAVVDTHPDVIRFKYLKNQAHINETHIPNGLGFVLQVIREGSGEYVIFTVDRPADGNWRLVKGNFNKKELANMQLTKQIPPEKQPRKKGEDLESLKKKELTAIQKLNSDEKSGMSELPVKVREKLLEKLRKGWVVEKPFDFLDEFYDKSEINSVFADKIKIYKLNPSEEFFKTLKDNSAHIYLKKGFCKSLNIIKNKSDLKDTDKTIIDHFVNKCQTKFKGEYGVSQINRF